MYRIETHTFTDTPTTLGPCIEIEDVHHARAFALGLRAEGLDVELLFRARSSDPWRTVSLAELDPAAPADRVFDEYVVIVRRGSHAERANDYELATPCIFLTRSLADDYARTMRPEREPLVVRGRFSTLKF
jgi:hypothetical protein